MALKQPVLVELLGERADTGAQLLEGVEALDPQDLLLEGLQELLDVIASLELRSTGVDEDELLAALRLIGQLADDKRRWLPGFSPSAFIDAQWRPHVVDTGRGRFDRRTYELCAAYELRSGLRAGGGCRPAAA